MNLIQIYRHDGHQMLVLESLLNDYLSAGFSRSAAPINTHAEEIIQNTIQESITGTILTEIDNTIQADTEVEIVNTEVIEAVKEIEEELTPQPTITKKSKKWT